MAKVKNKLTGATVEVSDQRAEELLSRQGYSTDAVDANELYERVDEDESDDSDEDEDDE